MNTSLLWSNTITLTRNVGPRLAVQLVVDAVRDTGARTCRRLGRWAGLRSACFWARLGACTGEAAS